jgi:hypothetical protein
METICCSETLIPAYTIWDPESYNEMKCDYAAPAALVSGGLQAVEGTPELRMLTQISTSRDGAAWICSVVSWTELIA